MKFVVTNNIPDNNTSIDKDWVPVKEPKSLVTITLISLPIGIITTTLFLFVTTLLGIDIYINNNRGIFVFIILFVIIIPIHELLHALLFPDSIKSNKVIFGFIPRLFIFFAHYKGQIYKKRFVFSLVAPLLFITILPTILLIAFRINSSIILFIAAINLFLSSGDILGAFIIQLQVPKNALIQNRGIRSYWSHKNSQQ